MLNKNSGRFRQRRQTNQFRGKFRGQTQSQYLNLGNGEQKEGKAEAESTQQSSRAVVSKCKKSDYHIWIRISIFIRI